MKSDKIEEIHASYLNGQGKQMVQQIDEYGTYDFWEGYMRWLRERFTDTENSFVCFSRVTIIYFRIKGR